MCTPARHYGISSRHDRDRASPTSRSSISARSQGAPAERRNSAASWRRSATTLAFSSRSTTGSTGRSSTRSSASCTRSSHCLSNRNSLIDKRKSRHFRGWEAEGSEYTNNRPDIREQIDVWSEWPTSQSDDSPSYFRLLGPNQWMPDDVLPAHRAVTLEWMRQCGVARRSASRSTRARSRPRRTALRPLLRQPAHVAHEVHPLSADTARAGGSQRPPRRRFPHRSRARARPGPSGSESRRGLDRLSRACRTDLSSTSVRCSKA